MVQGKMGDQGLFLLKLLLLSAAFSAAIKYGAPWLKIPATSSVALGFVLTPSLVLAGILLWRGWQFQKQQNRSLP